MPLFAVEKTLLTQVQQTNFSTEKQLQQLIEKNLLQIFNCRFVASEFSTGVHHAGRIDTLALSEDNNPVIIEYKKVESSDLINQSLFYLAWLKDHRGDFEIAAQRTLGPTITVDWSDMRVICLAPNYKKYDLHAVQMMGANIELWTYRLFTNGALYLDEVLQKSYVESQGAPSGKNPIMVAAGKKAAITKASSTYTFEQHIEGKPEKIKELALAVQDFVMALDPAIEEAPKKLYVAYRTSQNIVCMEVQQKKISLFLKLEPKQLKPLPANARDVTDIGHFGTGDLELLLTSTDDLEDAKKLVVAAYEKVGG
jgi:predicted transport protein